MGATVSKRKPKRNAGGRPNTGLTEARVLVMGPAELLEAVDARAAELGITTREAWRRAARAWLLLAGYVNLDDLGKAGK